MSRPEVLQRSGNPVTERLTNDNSIIELGPDSKPVCEVSRGQNIRIETPAPIGLRMTSLDDRRPPRQIPITGPIAVRGAQPGDALRVTIREIRLFDWGMVWTAPWLGLVKDVGLYERTVAISDGAVEFGAGIRLPLRPMIGFIGVAPSDRSAECLAVGDWGGNLDTLTITQGATVILPVGVEGGLLAIGDVHATMGEGEVIGIALECGAELLVTIDVSPTAAPPCPMVETADHVAVLVTAPAVSEAAQRAVRIMSDLLAKRQNLDWNDAYALVGLVGDLRISQAVNPFGYTLRLELPRYLWDREAQ